LVGLVLGSQTWAQSTKVPEVVATGKKATALVWNLTRSRESERRLVLVCTGFGIALACVGTLAWCAFTVLLETRGTPCIGNHATPACPR